MNVYLGNLSVEQIEKRSGVIFPDELKEFLKNNHQSNASNIKPGEWHCFDIPFEIVCGDLETAKLIYSYLQKMSSEFKENLKISVSE